MNGTRQQSCSKNQSAFPLFLSPAEILHSLIVDMTYVGWRKAAAASGRGGRGWGGARGALQAEMLITRGSK